MVASWMWRICITYIILLNVHKQVRAALHAQHKLGLTTATTDNAHVTEYDQAPSHAARRTY